MSKRTYAYKVLRSSVEEVPVGTLLLYPSGKEVTQTEYVFHKDGTLSGTFSMELVAQCWVVDNKIQFERPPLKSGELTNVIMASLRKEFGEDEPEGIPSPSGRQKVHDLRGETP